MIILIYGKDTFRANKRITELMEEHKKRHASGLNLRRLEAKSISFEDLRSEMFEFSMFKEKKLIILENLSNNAKLKEEFLKRGDIFIEGDNVLILYERGDIPARDKLINYCEKNKIKIEEFLELSGAKIKAWINKRVEEMGGKISSAAAERLVEFVGSDLWRMDNELAKALNYSRANKNEEITVKDVEEMVIPEWEVNIFDAVDAIAANDKKKAINLFKKQIEDGAEIPYLFAMIAWQVKNIISAKAEGSGAKGISPFVLRKALYQAKNFELDHLKKIYARIVELDSALKVGRINPEAALDILILEM
ncbi:MAG: DNA polymerase III subunit delta [Candidatus Paceibacterota bacterium]